MSAALTPKRGEKAPPKSKPGAWDKPPRELSHTKRGPGRRPVDSSNELAPRVLAQPPDEKKLTSDWRKRGPLHIVKPVRAARIKAERDRKEAAA